MKAAASPGQRQYYRRTEVVCGRLTCKGCRRWRHVTDFKAASWRDHSKTLPSTFRTRCERCGEVFKATRRRLRERNHAQQRRAAEESRVRSILASVPREAAVLHELEGVLPLLVAEGVTIEDLDATPVPSGCPGCWKTDVGQAGLLCIRCPDSSAATRRREDMKAARCGSTSV